MRKSGKGGAYCVADEKEFVIIVKAKDLVKHTFKMATAKRFPNKYRFTIANRV